MSRGLLDTDSLVNGILGFVRVFCRAKGRQLPCHQRGISILSGIQRRQTSTMDQISCAQIMKSLPLLMPRQLRATTMLQLLIRNNPTSDSWPRLPLLLIILVREVYPECREIRQVVLRLLFLQLPHAPVIFFPEACFTVLDTSGINIVIAHVATSSSMEEFRAVTFPAITLTTFPIEAILYQPITVTAGFALHSDHRFRPKAIRRNRQRAKRLSLRSITKFSDPCLTVRKCRHCRSLLLEVVGTVHLNPSYTPRLRPARGFLKVVRELFDVKQKV